MKGVTCTMIIHHHIGVTMVIHYHIGVTILIHHHIIVTMIIHHHISVTMIVHHHIGITMISHHDVGATVLVVLLYAFFLYTYYHTFFYIYKNRTCGMTAIHQVTVNLNYIIKEAVKGPKIQNMKPFIKHDNRPYLLTKMVNK